jgi:hypothetical protein
MDWWRVWRLGNAFAVCVWPRGFWFRLFGYGPHVKARAGHVPLFSERYGYRKALYIGPLRIEWLRPAKPLR